MTWLQITALSLLAIFYGIYFIKLLLMKLQGIQADQMASGKHGREFYMELLMKIANYLVVLAMALSILFVNPISNIYLNILGLVLAIFGTVVFFLAIWYMRNNWRAGIPLQDKTNLVTNGIYRISRNPAFLGFGMLYVGICIMYFNPFLLIATLLTIALLHNQILMEEKFLIKTFGKEYEQYMRSVSRYFGQRR